MISGDITWRSAIHADRRLLHAFSCADKPKRSMATGWKPVHKKPWAYEVQSMVRSLEPPIKFPRFMTVGLDDEGIVAVAHYTEISDDQVHIELVAVTKRAHRTGLAAELGSVVTTEVLARFTELEREHLVVTADVHPENVECRAFCESAGFGITARTGSGYDVWSAEFWLVDFDQA